MRSVGPLAIVPSASGRPIRKRLKARERKKMGCLFMLPPSISVEALGPGPDIQGYQTSSAGNYT
jgi:hypothetical protein